MAAPALPALLPTVFVIVAVLSFHLREITECYRYTHEHNHRRRTDVRLAGDADEVGVRVCCAPDGSEQRSRRPDAWPRPWAALFSDPVNELATTEQVCCTESAAGAAAARAAPPLDAWDMD